MQVQTKFLRLFKKVAIGDRIDAWRVSSERAGLRAVCYVLMAIRRPDVTGLRVVALKIAAMDHLFRPVLEFMH